MQPRSPFAPVAGRANALEYRRAFQAWVADLDWDLFVTLNFNGDTSLASARAAFRKWLARLDHRVLGRNWAAMTQSERILAVATVENPRSNLHLHVLVHLPLKARELHRAEITHAMQLHWAKLVPSGQCHFDRVRDTGVARYVAKQLDRPGHAEMFMLSNEFHNAT